MNLSDTVQPQKLYYNMLAQQRRVTDRRAEYYRKLETCDSNSVRYKAQSILTGLVAYPELPTDSQARDILAWSSRAPAYA